MIRLLTLVIFAFTCCLYAEDDASESDPFTSSLAFTQSLLPTIVQSVSTVSGEWLNFATDLVVAGLKLSSLTAPTRQIQIKTAWDTIGTLIENIP